MQPQDPVLTLSDRSCEYAIINLPWQNVEAERADVDILTSWNFRHIVHFDKIRMFNAVNLQYGYKAIQICSPREVTYHGNQDC